MDQLSIPRPFSHQPMLARDPTSTGQQGEGLSRDYVIRLGRFRVLPRALDGRPVELGSRAFDLLMVLIRSPGVLLTKNEILSRVWPDVVVEQNNLKVQMAALRKVLNQYRDIKVTWPTPPSSSKSTTGVHTLADASSISRRVLPPRSI
jgi:DNA-binding response OmpR family regulator